MATFMKTPTTWFEAQVADRGPTPKRGKDRPLGYQTRLVRIDEDRYAVRHVDTDIVTFLRDGSLILDAAVVSRTTAQRMNVFTPEGVKVTIVGDAYEVTSVRPEGVMRLEQGDWVRLTEFEMGSEVAPLPGRTPGVAAKSKRWS